jgi:hypothetical protein
MGKHFARLIIIVLILILAKPAYAQEEHRHGEHNAHFFKINGQLALVYPIARQSSVKDFALPDYKSSRDFLINQKIDIEIDPTVLETAYIKAHNSTIPDARFIWKFGDGQSSYGTKNRHSYTRAGSYLLSVYIESKLFDDPLLFKTVLIHVLPNRAYKLPKAVVTVNNQLIPEHFHGRLKISFTEKVQLEGTNSVSGSSKIISYFWDLSDRASSQDPKLKHAYNRASYNAIPILRVKDSRGFISDASVEIINRDASSDK